MSLVYLSDTFWDGGVRVVSFVAGPFIPAARRGAEFWGLAHSADWWRTLTSIAGGKIPVRAIMNPGLVER